jgi:4-aminobutyrate aminotransferase/(S)-3-amino-2-methylpropionate transaminase
MSAAADPGRRRHVRGIALPSNAELHIRRQHAVPRGVSNSLAVYAERASNAELWDVEGKRYIDFASGISVLNTGHVHPKVQAAIARQLEKLTHTCFQVTPYESYIALAEQLNALAPGATPKKTIFLTTGAEAVENAVKIARFHTRRSAVIAFSGGFHGRTLACISLTGKVQPYKSGFGPMLPEIYHLPFPMAYHGVTTEHALQVLEQLFKADVDPARVAAIIIEPVQGEGGFYAAPPELLRRLRALCDTHGIVLIADEIQSGFGRTGRMFAIEHSGIEPDLITVAKSIAGGVPLSAVIGKAEIMDSPPPGGLGGTFAGSPLGCAAGLAVLEVMPEGTAGALPVHRRGARSRRHGCGRAGQERPRRCSGCGSHQGAGAGRRAAGFAHPLLRHLFERDPLPRAADHLRCPVEGGLPPVRARTHRSGGHRPQSQSGRLTHLPRASGALRRGRRSRQSVCGNTRSRRRVARSGD